MAGMGEPVWAVVVAAGEGVRFRRGAYAHGPRKPFAPLAGRPILLRTLEAVAACPDIERVVVVLAADDIAAAESLLSQDRKRLRVHSRKAMHGILFIDFIALIIYSWIHQRLKSGPLAKTYTMNEVFYELKKLSVVTIGENQKILTELSKRQRVIFETFGIAQPTLT